MQPSEKMRCPFLVPSGIQCVVRRKIANFFYLIGIYLQYSEFHTSTYPPVKINNKMALDLKQAFSEIFEYI